MTRQRDELGPLTRLVLLGAEDHKKRRGAGANLPEGATADEVAAYNSGFRSSALDELRRRLTIVRQAQGRS